MAFDSRAAADHIADHQVRETFLSGGEVVGSVHSDVLDSWRRCAEWGVKPGGSVPSRLVEVDLEQPMLRAALPVLDRLNEHLADTRTALFLGDQHAAIARRWVGERSLLRELDRIRSIPAVSFAEEVAGTNGLGTPIHVGRPLVISGAEHYASRYQAFCCAGVPIREPGSGEVIGAVTLACQVEDRNRLMLPMVLEAIDHIHSGLLSLRPGPERALLARFNAALRTDAGPFIVLDGSITLTSPTATALVGGEDPARLWEWARADRRGPDVVSDQIRLESGVVVRCRAETITDGSESVGRLIRLEPLETGDGGIGQKQLDHSRANVPDSGTALSQLLGKDGAWRAVEREATRHADFALSVLVRGEAGTGKLALLQAMWADRVHAAPEQMLEQEPIILDVALVPVAGRKAFLQNLRRALSRPGRFVVLRHIELFDREMAAAVCTTLDEQDELGVALGATVTVDANGERCPSTPASEIGSEPLGVGDWARLADRVGVCAIDLPALWSCASDIPALVDAATREFCAGPVPSWNPLAMSAVSGAEWPDNIRQLRNLVRRVVAGSDGGEIRVEDLPNDLIADRRATLSQLENNERFAIIAALRDEDGNKQAAARRLGIARSTIYRKINAYQIVAS